jgi:tetratricopeptide (TPR) repeat protein
MNVSDFTYLLQHPDQVRTPVQIHQLEELLRAYPYFQPARALHLLGLKHLNSYKYNAALKVTAAGCADREVLFDLITSEDFPQNRIADSITGKAPLGEQETVWEEVAPNPESHTDMVGDEEDSPLPRSAREAEQILDPKLFRSRDPEVDKSVEAARDSLQMGSPLPFTRDEKHSFSEWLQLASLRTPAGGEPPAGEAPEGPGEASDAGDRQKKFELIDRFIARNPKITPGERKPSDIDISESLKLDKKELMTETLARVYLEQGKYKKAIQAYRILILKYPEKSGFFADQIKAVEKLRDQKP